MNKYRWNINEIRTQMEKDLKNPDILENKDLLNYTKSVYNILFCLYDIYRSNSFNEKNNLDETEEPCYINNEAFSIMYNQIINDVSKIKEIDFNQSKIIINFNNDELIEIVEEFIKQIPDKNLLKYFKEYFNPNNNFINIIYKKYNIIDANGICISNFNNKKAYTCILRENSTIDILVVLHEFFHAYLRKEEIYNFQSQPNSIYAETEGYFANILANYLSKKIIGKYMFDKVIYGDFNNILVNSKYFKIINNESTSSNDNLSFIKEILDESFSYLSAIDLFYLYKIDPEKALFFIKKIPSLTGQNIRSELLENNITFLEDNCKNFKTLSKELRKPRN